MLTTYESTPKWTDVAGAIAAIVGVVGVLYTLGSSALSQKRSALWHEAQFDMDLGSTMREVDRLFVERPALYPYFFNDTPIPTSGDVEYQVRACAEFVIDVIADIAMQRVRGRLSTEDFETWCDLIKSYYANSPALRDTYEELKGSYGDEMRQLLGVDRYESARLARNAG